MPLKDFSFYKHSCSCAITKQVCTICVIQAGRNERGNLASSCSHCVMDDGLEVESNLLHWKNRVNQSSAEHLKSFAAFTQSVRCLGREEPCTTARPAFSKAESVTMSASLMVQSDACALGEVQGHGGIRRNN